MGEIEPSAGRTENGSSAIPVPAVNRFEFGSALVNCISSEPAGRPQIDLLLAELRGLRDGLSEDAGSALLAAGINNAVASRVKSQNVGAAKALLEELKTLRADQPDSFQIAEISGDSVGGAIALYAITQDIDEVTALLEQLRNLVARFPQDPMPRHLAKGIANAVIGHAQLKQGDQATQLVHELFSMVDASPADTGIALQAARGLALSIVGTGNSADASTLAAQLIQLHLRFPNERGGSEMLAQGAINAAAMLGSFQEFEAAAQFVSITSTLSAASSGDLWMLARHAEMLAVAIACNATEGDVEAVNRLVAEVKDVRRQTSDFPVQFQCARAFAKASVAYGNRREMVRLQSVLKWLRGLTEDWPEARAMAGQLAWGLFNALMANLSGRDQAEEKRLKRELQELESRFPKLHMGDPPHPSMHALNR